MTDQDLSSQLQQQVLHASAEKQKLEIRGGNSKSFYGRQQRPEAQLLEVGGHTGVINYQPAELVLTVRTGTPLSEINALLEANHQVLPFEPPAFGSDATLGGTLACGLSGPSRPYEGSARDHILGLQLLNGKGQVLRFGGEVMKNVAGYDTSRLMVGAFGTLGVLLEASMKVLPAAATQHTLVHETTESEALTQIDRLRSRYLPVTAWCYAEGRAFTRLSGSKQNVAAVCKTLGGETLARADVRWRELREHQLPFFNDPRPLWRLSLPSGTPPIDLSGRQLLDWGGCQRWLLSDADAPLIQSKCREAGGHAELFRDAGSIDVFQDLDASLIPLHQRIKASFDPDGLFNPGRISAEW